MLIKPDPRFLQIWMCKKYETQMRKHNKLLENLLDLLQMIVEVIGLQRQNRKKRTAQFKYINFSFVN